MVCMGTQVLTCALWCPQLCDLYENDCIFDKFNACMSGNGEHIATGTYSNFFRVLKREEAWPAKSETLLEASRDPLRKRFQTPKARRPSLTQQHRMSPAMEARLQAFSCLRYQRFHADKTTVMGHQPQFKQHTRSMSAMPAVALPGMLC